MNDTEKIAWEAKLVEQEHRIIPICMNIYKARTYDKDDPRRAASLSALIYRIISGGGTIIIFSGFVAGATLYYTAKQTEAMFSQNRLISKEIDINTENIEDQRWIDALGRRSALIDYLYTLQETTADKPKYSSRLRSEALIEYIELQTNISKKSFSKFLNNGTMPLDSAMYKFSVNLTGAHLEEVKVSQIDFSRAVLHEANFGGAELHYSNFYETPLDWTNFSDANLLGVDISGASLLGSNLMYASLSEIKWNATTKVLFANIHGVKKPPAGFVEWALENGAVDEPDIKKWRAMRNKLKK